MTLTKEEATKIKPPADVLEELRYVEMNSDLNHDKLEAAFTQILAMSMLDIYINMDDRCRAASKALISQLSARMYIPGRSNMYCDDAKTLYHNTKKVIIEDQPSIWHIYINDKILDIPTNVLENQAYFRIEYLKKFYVPAPILSKNEWFQFLRDISLLKRKFLTKNLCELTEGE